MRYMEIPRLLFKYRALNNKNDLARLLEMLKEKQIYLPTYDKLNDPLEGVSTYISLGVPGQGIVQDADEDLPVLHEIRSKYKIISFSSTCNSPQLWAHYGGNYTGICFGFSSAGIFHNVKKVVYSSHKPLSRFEPSDAELDDIILKNFLHKEKHWSHEHEWRYIEKKKIDICALRMKI